MSGHAGMTLNLKKCQFAKSEVKFVGQLIGSGQRRVDPDKLKAVKNMKIPQSKKQVRQIMGFFSYFREYIPNFSALAKPLTDSTAKRVPNQIPWGQAEQLAFEKLKTELCKATDESLAIVDFKKPFSIHVDSSNYAVGGALTQPDLCQRERPVAFISKKLTKTQQSWSTIKKETFATIWALGQFRNWIFGKPVTLFTDHNPITYLTDVAPKSAKLMRWALANQQYDVTFCYKAGRANVVADCLSRMDQAVTDKRQLGWCPLSITGAHSKIHLIIPEFVYSVIYKFVCLFVFCIIIVHGSLESYAETKTRPML